MNTLPFINLVAGIKIFMTVDMTSGGHGIFSLGVLDEAHLDVDDAVDARQLDFLLNLGTGDWLQAW